MLGSASLLQFSLQLGTVHLIPMLVREKEDLTQLGKKDDFHMLIYQDSFHSQFLHQSEPNLELQKFHKQPKTTLIHLHLLMLLWHSDF